MTVAFKQQVGTQGASTAGSVLTITLSAAIAVGDFVVVRVAADNLSATTPTFTATDSGGNTYVTQRQGAVNATAAAGVAGAVITTKATAAVNVGQTINVQLSGTVTARAGYAETFTGVENTVRSTAVSATGASTSAASPASGTVVAGDLVIGAVAWETRAAITGDADTGGGTWSTIFAMINAAGGTDASRVTAAGQYKIPNTAAAQTYNVASVSAEWLAMVVVMQATPDPAITQAAYRWYDEGTESGAVALAAQDTAVTGDITNGDATGTLRIRLQSTTAVAVPATDDFQLQVELNGGGTWDNVSAISTFARVYDSPNLTNGAATTNRLTGGTGSFVAGKVSEDGLMDDLGWAGNNHTELVYALKITAGDNAPGNTLRFRVRRNGATATMTYTVTPTINIIQTLPAVTQAAYRFYNDGTESGSTALAAQSTAPSVDVTSDVNLQLRVRLQSTTAVALPGTNDWQLQWEKNSSGTWNNVSAVGGIIDENQASNWDTNLPLWASNFRLVSQSFTGNGQPVTKVGAYLGKFGSPTDPVFARIEPHSGTFGTSSVPSGGSVLATSSGKFSSSFASAGPGTEPSWVDFIFDGSFTPVAGTKYCVTIDFNAGDSSNYVVAGFDGTGAHPGNMGSFSGSSWSADITSDLIFRVQTGSGATTAVPYDSSSLTDDAVTTNRLTGGTGTFVAGEVSETGLASNLGWAGNNYTELLYSITLKQADFANGDTLKFRVLFNGATSFMTYTQTPTISITKAAGPFDPLTSIPWQTVFWASDPGQTPPSNGANVTAWRQPGSITTDEWVNGGVTTPTFVSSWTNTRPAVNFTGNSRLLATYAATPTLWVTVVIVGAAVGLNGDFCDDPSGASARVLIDKQGTDWRYYRGSGPFSVTGGDTNPHLFIGRFNNQTTDYLKIDGVTKMTGSATGSLAGTQICVGCGGSGSHDQSRVAFGAVLVGRDLTTQEESDLLTWYTAYYITPPGGGGPVALAGASSGISTVTSALVRDNALAAITGVGTSTTTSALAVARPLASTASAGLSTVTSDITVAKAPVVLVAASGGTSTVTSALAKAIPIVASVGGVATVTSAVAVARPLVGLAAGLSTTTSAMVVARALVGSAVGSTTVIADVTIAVAGINLVGQSDGVSTCTETGFSVARTLVGASNALSTVTGVQVVSRALIATVSGVSTVTATTLVRALATTAASGGLSTVTGALAAARPLTANVAGTSTVTAALSVARPLAASSAGIASVTATTAARAVPLAAGATGATTAAGAMGASIALVASAAGGATGTAALAVVRSLIASSAGTATTSAIAVVSGAGGMSAFVPGTSTVTGDLRVARALTGNASGVAVATGALTKIVPLTAASGGLSTTTAVTAVARRLVGSSTGVSTVTADFVGTTALVGSSSGVATTTALLGRAVPMTAVASGSSTASGITVGNGLALVATSGGLSTVIVTTALLGRALVASAGGSSVVAADVLATALRLAGASNGLSATAGELLLVAPTYGMWNGQTFDAIMYGPYEVVDFLLTPPA